MAHGNVITKQWHTAMLLLNNGTRNAITKQWHTAMLLLNNGTRQCYY